MRFNTRLKHLETAMNAESAPPPTKAPVDYDAIEDELMKILGQGRTPESRRVRVFAPNPLFPPGTPYGDVHASLAELEERALERFADDGGKHHAE